MKFQYYVALETIKKNAKYALLLILFLSLNILFFLNEMHSIEEINREYLSYIFVPSLENVAKINYLVVLYNSFLLVFFSVRFLNYERFNSSTNAITRYSSKAHFIYKLLLSTTHTILWLSFYILLVYNFFKDFLPFHMINVLDLFTYYIVILLGICTFSYNHRFHKCITIIALISILYAILYFELLPGIFIAFFLFIVNFLTVDLKTE